MIVSDTGGRKEITAAAEKAKIILSIMMEVTSFIMYINKSICERIFINRLLMFIFLDIVAKNKGCKNK
ncbi:MAG: hypothetical protein ACR5K4_00925 [Sodalis sp. (in: enterobacteria)]